MNIKLNEQGLLPAIAQDANTGQVLMMGYMIPGSLIRTIEGFQVWFYSGSRATHCSPWDTVSYSHLTLATICSV